VVYKLSERLKQNKITSPSEDDIDLGKVATVFIVFGIVSLITAWIFSMETERLFSDTVRTYAYPSASTQHPVAGEQEESRDAAIIGPIAVQKYKEVYEITIASSLPKNSWTFVEGEVLDAKKDYLFSFGKELWHEAGYDSDGAWQESDNSYSIKLTFPKPGQYYLNLKTDGSYNPDAVRVTISKKRGSVIPHVVFAIFTLVIGIVLNEIRNKTLSGMARRMNND
jgi:hypothetical protein